MLNCGEEITFTGELDFSTYNKLSSTCLCVIAPITTGTGIKIKILEAVQKIFLYLQQNLLQKEYVPIYVFIARRILTQTLSI